MKDMKVKYKRETTDDFTNGKIYTLTDKGLICDGGYQYITYLEHEGNTLLEKWNTWDGDDEDFELVEEEPTVTSKPSAFEIKSKNVDAFACTECFYINDAEFDYEHIDELLEIIKEIHNKMLILLDKDETK